MAHGNKKPILKYGFDKSDFLTNFYTYLKTETNITEDDIDKIVEYFKESFEKYYKAYFNLYELTNGTLKLYADGVDDEFNVNENDILVVDNDTESWCFYRKDQIINLMILEITIHFNFHD